MAQSKAAKKSVLTSDEKAAMRELVRERKAALSKADAEKECLAKIAEMPPSLDRAMAKKIHALIKPGSHARGQNGTECPPTTGMATSSVSSRARANSRHDMQH